MVVDMTPNRRSAIAALSWLAALALGGSVCGPVRAQLAVDPLEDEVLTRTESTVSQAIEDRVQDQVEDAAVQQLQEQLEEGVETQIEATVSETVEAQVQDQVEDAVTEPLKEQLREQPEATAAEASRPFVEAFDEDGWPVERDTWMMLIAPEHLSRIERWGFTVKQRRPLDGLGLVLVRLDAPDDRNLGRVAARIVREAPGTVVDYNHVYRTDDAVTPRGGDCARQPVFGRTPPLLAPGRRVAVGIVDTAVMTGHPALKSADIVQKDFVPFEGERPRNHGTAVASILVGQSDTLTGRRPGSRLYAASTFFRDPKGGIGATTESLVEALAWLGKAGVPVINMSLSGPPNHLLRAVIDRMTADGAIIIAAVGNNGPAGRPLYPAAYDSVVGVTAVDACNRIFRYANRGRHVTFSAPGVSIRVALDDGGYGFEQGTSMAAPYAAAVIASALADSAADPAEIVQALETAALDLGARGFDDTYGFGLIGPLR
jgi:hypothetical protein